MAVNHKASCLAWGGRATKGRAETQKKMNGWPVTDIKLLLLWFQSVCISACVLGFLIALPERLRCLASKKTVQLEWSNHPLPHGLLIQEHSPKTWSYESCSNCTKVSEVNIRCASWGQARFIRTDFLGHALNQCQVQLGFFYNLFVLEFKDYLAGIHLGTHTGT